MQSAYPPKAGLPGRLNSITDVPGVRVGQVQNRTAPFLTGTSVVYFPSMSVASVDQRSKLFDRASKALQVTALPR